MASTWKRCSTCKGGGRIYETTKDVECLDCYGRGGHWVDNDSGYHTYHKLNDTDPLSEKNNT